MVGPAAGLVPVENYPEQTNPVWEFAKRYLRRGAWGAGRGCRTAHSSKEVSGAERSMYRKRSRRRCR